MLFSLIRDWRSSSSQSQIRNPLSTRSEVTLRVSGILRSSAASPVTLVLHCPTIPLDLFYSGDSLKLGADGSYVVEARIPGAKAGFPLVATAHDSDGGRAEARCLAVAGEPLTCTVPVLQMLIPEPMKPDSQLFAIANQLHSEAQFARLMKQSPADSSTSDPQLVVLARQLAVLAQSIEQDNEHLRAPQTLPTLTRPRAITP